MRWYVCNPLKSMGSWILHNLKVRYYEKLHWEVNLRVSKFNRCQLWQRKGWTLLLGEPFQLWENRTWELVSRIVPGDHQKPEVTEETNAWVWELVVNGFWGLLAFQKVCEFKDLSWVYLSMCLCWVGFQPSERTLRRLLCLKVKQPLVFVVT